jgi:hypothetical protein
LRRGAKVRPILRLGPIEPVAGTYTDIASRTYDHNWRLDPIVRSLLDTDFYKLLMLQMIRHLYPDVSATFQLIKRSKAVRIADEIDEGELRAQLDHARSLRFSKKEMIWLAGNSFYGERQMFSPDFIEWLAGFSLPAYDLRRSEGQYELRFQGGTNLTNDFRGCAPFPPQGSTRFRWSARWWRRTAGGHKALGQPGQGNGRARRNRPLPQDLRRRRPGERNAVGVNRSA